MDRPALRYFGGKFMLADWIISFMPEHKVYVEPFGGGASVLLKKPSVYAEIYNDKDSEIVNVFKMLRDRPAELKRLLELTPWARDEFDLSKVECEDELEKARRTIARSFMGFADATTGPKHAGFRAVMSQGKPAAKVFADYPNFIDQFTQRLRGVVIENRCGLKVMQEHDSESTLHYVDPPYVHSSRKSKNNYRHELDDKSHEELCDFLTSLKGSVLLSGYENSIYERLGWAKFNKETIGDGGVDRIETLWLNKRAQDGQRQMGLF